MFGGGFYAICCSPEESKDDLLNPVRLELTSSAVSCAWKEARLLTEKALTEISQH